MTFDATDKALIAKAFRTAADFLDPPITATTPPPTTTAPPVTTTPPATTAPAPAPTPSGDYTGLSLGNSAVWSQTPTFQEPFLTLAPSGQFATLYPTWSVYQKGWTDTSHVGTYDPARISVVDLPAENMRVLRQMVTTNADGTFGGCVLQPKVNGAVGYFTTMRYSERRRLTQQDNGHDVLLGWPAKDTDWPKISGEPDHVEYDCASNPTISGWLHVIGATTGQDHQVALPSDVKAYDAFHVVTIEQIANDSYRRYIDGKLYNVVLNPGKAFTVSDNAAPNKMILPAGYSVPGADPLRICKQLESNGTKPARGGVIVDTDWCFIQAHV